MYGDADCIIRLRKGSGSFVAEASAIAIKLQVSPPVPGLPLSMPEWGADLDMAAGPDDKLDAGAMAPVAAAEKDYFLAVILPHVCKVLFYCQSSIANMRNTCYYRSNL